MVDLDEAVVARYETQGKRFEALIHPDLPEKWRADPELELEEYIVVDVVYSKFRRPKAKDGAGYMHADATDSERAKDEDLQAVFGTLDFIPILKRILEKGEIQLTTTQRKEFAARKRARIVTEIARNAINPQTGAPHPPDRISAAMDEAKVSIDPFLKVEEQINRVLDALRPLLPIRFETVRIAVRLPGDGYGRCYQTLRGLGKITKEEWTGDGAWIGVVEIPAGLQGQLYDEMNRRVKGEFDIKKLE